MLVLFQEMEGLWDEVEMRGGVSAEAKPVCNLWCKNSCQQTASCRLSQVIESLHGAFSRAGKFRAIRLRRC